MIHVTSLAKGLLDASIRYIDLSEMISSLILGSRNLGLPAAHQIANACHQRDPTEWDTDSVIASYDVPNRPEGRVESVRQLELV